MAIIVITTHLSALLSSHRSKQSHNLSQFLAHSEESLRSSEVVNTSEVCLEMS